MNTIKKPHIVIIGASFAGLSAFLMLRKRLWNTVDITLIDKNDTFTYIPALHEAILDEDVLKDFQFSLSKRYPEFKQARISSINKDKTVHTSDWEIISFDFAVIATWSRTNYFGKEDFEKNTLSLRWAQDVAPLNQKIRTAKDIVVVGWGFTWIEIASSIATKISSQQTITLIHSKDRLVDQYDPSVSEKAKKRMTHHWVRLILWERAEDIQENYLITSKWTRIESTCTILSSWIKINDEEYDGELSFDVEYESSEENAIYYAWDVAIHKLMTTAHNAMIEWRHVGNLIADKIEGKNTQYPELESRTTLALALGTRDAIITNGKRSISVPFFWWFAKNVVKRRVLFEFKRKVMLRV